MAKVMIIDDSNTIRRSAEAFLKNSGHQLFLVEDGYSALKEVKEKMPDIIFIDIMMPRLDGYQTCASIKSIEEFKHIPIIMLSSKDSIFDKAKSKLAGADDYIIKPFNKTSLPTAISNFLN